MNSAAPVTSPRLRGRPERVFVSVDESTGRSTLSFQPPDVCPPFQQDDDKTGARAMREAQAILKQYPGCTIHGPHFHAARPQGRWKTRKRATTTEGSGNES